MQTMLKYAALPSQAAAAHCLTQPFHNDVCDILSMYALARSASGGKSNIASAGQVYNEIAATRPDLIHTLSKDDWPFDSYLYVLQA